MIISDVAGFYKIQLLKVLKTSLPITIVKTLETTAILLDLHVNLLPVPRLNRRPRLSALSAVAFEADDAGLSGHAETGEAMVGGQVEDVLALCLAVDVIAVDPQTSE